jgi:hypothetical protein
MAKSREIVWEGAEALRPLLIPVTHLERHPENPRRGDVDAIRASLRRWGQTMPILTDGRRIIAGNHTYLAGVAEGFTHVAQVVNEFATPEDAMDYLLADNRLPEHGAYDETERLRLLEEVAAADTWEGTGYVRDDLEELRALQHLVPADPGPSPGDPTLTPEELEARRERLQSGRALAEVPLLLDAAQYREFDELVTALRPRHAPDGGATEVVLNTVRAVAMRRNLS